MEVTQENYFEAAQALYWYCVDYHGGISCPLYSILSARLQYTPSYSELGVNDDDDSSEFYQALESGAIKSEKEEEINWNDGTWESSPDDVIVTKLGIAENPLEIGLICSSYNAG